MQIAIMWMNGMLAILFNITVFLVVPHVESLQNSTGKAMLSLAVTDTCLGIYTQIRVSYMTIRGDFSSHPENLICKSDGFFNSFLAGISILTLTFINLDKLFMLSYPFHYPQLMTPKVTNGIIVTIWLTLFIMVCPAVLGWGGLGVKFYPDAYLCIIDFSINIAYTATTNILLLLFPTIAIFCSFLGIYRIVRRQKLQIAAQESIQPFSSTSHQSSHIRTLIIMTMGFYIMWTPYFIFVNIWELVTGHLVHPLVTFSFCWLGGANSFINPVVYVPTVRPYRVKLMSILKLDCFSN